MIRVNGDWWKHLFDELYLLTDARSVCDDTITNREVDVIERLLPIDPFHDILDMCGGHGRHSLELCRRGYKSVTVLDYSGSLLSLGKKSACSENLSIDFCRGDARCTGFEDESFQVVLILGNSFGYFLDKDDDLALLCEAFRVVKPGGFLCMDMADGDYVMTNFKPESEHMADETTIVRRSRELADGMIRVRETIIGEREKILREQTYVSRLYTESTLFSALESAGFSDIHIETGFTSHESPGDYGFMSNRILARARKNLS